MTSACASEATSGASARATRLRDRRNAPERVAQPGEIARPRRRERDARGDPLDVRRAGELVRDRPTRCAVVDPGGDGGVPRGGVLLRAQRMREPVAQQAAAGGGAAGVEQREQRGRRIAAQRLGDLEVAPRRGVEREVFARRSRRRASARARAPIAGWRRHSPAARRRRPWRDRGPRRRTRRGRACRSASRALWSPRRRRIATPADGASARVRCARAPRDAVGDEQLGDVQPLERGATSAAGTSVSVNCPDARLSQAMPVRCRPGFTATSRLSRLASSRSASVTVPGVTTRSTLRSTGPLLVAGSPICSQIATDSPSFISFAR